eukprot:TRINITY_DN14890_c0_g1_i1.p1 TRINITY_DN14890_c0_g1~~TRINITY_DN14890_c0_g1_i1.p1  ORF type:complete len:1027 (-),score=244.49 TRINITY_DN14890_c0_g1_i1:320-3400(-)
MGSSSESSGSVGTLSDDCAEASTDEAGSFSEPVHRWLERPGSDKALEERQSGVGGALLPSVDAAETLRSRANPVHIAVQQRSDRKKWTVISGIPPKLCGRAVCFSRILQALKRAFKTNGTTRSDGQGGTILQLQGDCWKAARHFLLREGLADESRLHIRCLLGGEGLGGLGSLSQLDQLEASTVAPGGGNLQRPFRKPPGLGGGHDAASSASWATASGKRSGVPRREPPKEPPPRKPCSSPTMATRESSSSSSPLRLLELNAGSSPQPQCGHVLPGEPGSTAAPLAADVGFDWHTAALELEQMAKARGHRGFDARRCLTRLEELLVAAHAAVPAAGSSDAVLTILCRLICGVFDAATSAFKRMKLDSWKRAYSLLAQYVDLLEANPTTMLREQALPLMQLNDSAPEAYTVLYLNLLRLDEELKKALASLAREGVDAEEHAGFIAELPALLGLLDAGRSLLRRRCQGLDPDPLAEGSAESAAASAAVAGQSGCPSGRTAPIEADWHLAAAILDSAHCVDAGLLARLDEALAMMSRGERRFRLPQEPVAHWLRALCAAVCASGDITARTRATLQHVFHHAIHGRYQEALTLLGVSCVAEQATKLDMAVQVLCNRTIALIGLCAFRHGRFHDARHFLCGICARGKTAELLGDRLEIGDHGLQLQTALCHGQLSVQAIRVAHLVSELLLAAPAMASEEQQQRHTKMGVSGAVENPVAIRRLRQLLAKFERSDYRGPPENSVECVLAAARHLLHGEWEPCAALFKKALDGCWYPSSEVPELYTMVLLRTKLSALEVYLLSCCSVYACFELGQLCAMFELDERVTHATVSRLMAEERLPAVWDESSRLVCVLEPAPRLPLGGMSEQLAALAGQIAAQNERQLQKLDVSAASSSARGTTEKESRPRKKELPPPPPPVKEAQAEDEGAAKAEQAGGGAGSKVGRQSRFRKDLINLNKAVQRWLKRELTKEMSRAETISCVQQSPVVLHLQEVQGGAFCFDSFLAALLHRGQATIESRGEGVVKPCPGPVAAVAA